MTPRADQPQVKEVAAWVQTRVVLRIIAILLAVAALLWVVYKLTAVILLLVLSIFFAYLVAPLVDVVEKPVNLNGRVIRIPRGVAIGVVYLFLFTVVGAGIYFLVPQFAAQFPEFKQQATSYYKNISDTSGRINQYFTDHRMPP
jgi:predicted PurR-regulated permease PerM